MNPPPGGYTFLEVLDTARKSRRIAFQVRIVDSGALPQTEKENHIAP